MTSKARAYSAEQQALNEKLLKMEKDLRARIVAKAADLLAQPGGWTPLTRKRWASPGVPVAYSVGGALEEALRQHSQHSGWGFVHTYRVVEAEVARDIPGSEVPSERLIIWECLPSQTQEAVVAHLRGVSARMDQSDAEADAI